MSMLRKIATLMGLPVVLAALSGAATDPTLTYHGVFDADYTLSGDCKTPPGMIASGVWNVQIPDPVGETASAELMIHLNGKTAVRGNAKLVLVGTATENNFVAVTAEAPLLTFSLQGQDFTYRVSHGTCVITFNGHPTP